MLTMNMSAQKVTETETSLIKSSRGYTLVEALVTLLIVTLITMGVAMGVSFAQRQLNASMASSESKMLCSTIENIVRNEIEYAEIVSYDGTDIAFTSLNYANEGGANPTWKLAVVDEDGLVTDGRGEAVLCRDGEDGRPIVERLLASTAYMRGMSVSIDTSIAKEGQVGSESPSTLAMVDLTIYDGQGREIMSRQFGIKPQNTEIAING